MNDRWSKEDVSELERRAERGEVHWQIQLGLAYFHGIGLSKNLEAAKFWLSKAAMGGSDDEKFEVAKYYYLMRDRVALNILTDLRDSGYSPAFFMLGLIYRDGKIIPKDINIACDFWKSGSDQGHLYSRMFLSRQNFIEAPLLSKTSAASQFIRSIFQVMLQVVRDDQHISIKI